MDSVTQVDMPSRDLGQPVMSIDIDEAPHPSPEHSLWFPCMGDGRGALCQAVGYADDWTGPFVAQAHWRR